MVSTHPLISKSPSPCTNRLVTVVKEPIPLLSPSLSCSTVFQFPNKVLGFIFILAFQFYSEVNRDRKFHNTANSLCFFVDYYLVWSFGQDLGSVFISKSQGSLCVLFPRTNSESYMYHYFVWSILISCKSPSEFTCPPSLVWYYTLSVLVCCIRLWYDWSFHLQHYITYICCFVVSYIFLLWY